MTKVQASSIIDTSQPIGNVDFGLKADEQHWKRHWKVALGLERDMPGMKFFFGELNRRKKSNSLPESRLEIIEREDALTKQFPLLIVDAETKHGQFGQNHL